MHFEINTGIDGVFEIAIFVEQQHSTSNTEKCGVYTVCKNVQKQAATTSN